MELRHICRKQIGGLNSSTTLKTAFPKIHQLYIGLFGIFECSLTCFWRSCIRPWEWVYMTLFYHLSESCLKKKRLNGEFSLFHLNLSYVYVQNFLIKKPLSPVWACSSLYYHWAQGQDPKYSGKDWEWITYSCQIKLAHTHTHIYTLRTHTLNHPP